MLEHLIYYMYTFYTGILVLCPFCARWLKALGYLACYHMAIATMVTSSQGPSPEELTTTAISTVLSGGSPNPSLPPSSAPDQPSNMPAKSSFMSKKPTVRIPDLPSPSVGLAAARLLDVKPEEWWWWIMRDWLAQGLANTSNTGKLHHLRPFSWEKDGEELRSTYNFVQWLVSLGSVVTGHSWCQFH